ncbi:MAG: FKBP-type peptidyl-prolyl cis-trans isomerase [Anaerolineae bacterium]|nr:FKBP-type peptidyl-prolyl cis-trans isomerase [Anaerolineae bacterium]
MKKSYVVTTWAVLLAILLMMAACGPAMSTEQVEQMTREAAPATAEAAPTEVTLPAGPGIPPVEGKEITTDSGLKVIEIRAGSGPAPQEGDIVTMNLLGMMSDGTVFADTEAENVPITAMVTESDLFPGWLEGLLLMKEGGKARLIIPPTLAFGEEGLGGFIPPNETLTMDIDLIAVETPPTPPEVAESDLKTTDSGLKYFDIVEGKGDMPIKGQEVVTTYTAWVQDGKNTFIASSDQMGQPLTFTLGSEMGVFPGWDEGIATMKPGGKRFLVIPPELALGDQGGGRVAPNSTILMEVELLEVVPIVLPTDVSEDDYNMTLSGLKYYDIIVGDGDEAKTGDTVSVNYTGWLTDNVKFDSSIGRAPLSFTIGMGQVIPGWEEGVAGMRVGGKRQLVIPADLAYGDTGSGMIPPGATLIFEVELLDIQAKATE